MSMFSILLLMSFTCIQEPKVMKLNDLDQVEILNSIDDFKQYHTNSFKVNLFRRVSSENKELNGFPLANYVIGIVNYSDMESQELYTVGDFHSPQIISAIRQAESLSITIEHGKGQVKKNLKLIISRDSVKLLPNSN